MSGSDNNYYGMGFDQVGLLRQFALSFRSSVYQNSLPVETVKSTANSRSILYRFRLIQTIRRLYPEAVPLQANQMLNCPEPKRLHTCVICGKTDVWSEDWSWYGSLKNLDDGDVKVKACSDNCKAKHIKRDA